MLLHVLRKLYFNYFADEEAVYLLFILLAGLALILLFGRMLAPLLTALVVAYLLQGMVARLTRLGLPEALAVWMVFLLFLGMLVVTLVWLLPVIWKQTVNLVHDQLPRILQSGECWLRELPQAYPDMVSVQQVNAIIDLAQREITHAGQTVLSMSLSSIPGVMDALIFLVLVPLLVFFFMADRQRLLAWLVSLLPARRQVLGEVWAEMDLQIANYVRGKVLEVLIIAVACYVLFFAMGLNYALLLAVMVGLSTLIPYLGTIFATIPVAAVAYVQFGWSSELTVVMSGYAVIQFVDGNIIPTLMFSEVVDMHPVPIVLAVLIFGGIWGFWGVFFAIPLATLIRAVAYAWPKRGRAVIARE